MFPIFTSCKPLTIRSKQVEFRFITKVNHTPLFLCPQDMLCSKDKPFDFSLQSNVCIMESEPLIFPYSTYEKLFLEIGFPICSQNPQEIDAAVSKWFFKDILTIIKSYRLVVIGGLPVLGFGSSVLSALNLLITQ